MVLKIKHTLTFYMLGKLSMSAEIFPAFSAFLKMLFYYLLTSIVLKEPLITIKRFSSDSIQYYFILCFQVLIYLLVFNLTFKYLFCAYMCVLGGVHVCHCMWTSEDFLENLILFLSWRCLSLNSSHQLEYLWPVSCLAMLNCNFWYICFWEFLSFINL